jgi:hypothetical protein
MDQLVLGGVLITDEYATFLYNGGAGLQYPFIDANPSYSTPTSHWRFDRIYDTRISDDAAGFNDAYVAGGTAAQGTSGPFGYSADFTAGYVNASTTSFDPASLGPTWWWSADSITGLTDGQKVTCWVDKSGNNYGVGARKHAQQPHLSHRDPERATSRFAPGRSPSRVGSRSAASHPRRGLSRTGLHPAAGGVST